MTRIRSIQCSVRWTTRLVPVLIAGIVGYTGYVVVKLVCVNFLYKERREVGLVLTFLILYFLFLLLSTATYLRTFWVVKTDPGVVPLLPDSRGAKIEANRRKGKDGIKDIEARLGWAHADQDPDSPGLENFYRKDAFVCESDGRPRWCHDCGSFKPDRASHSREIARCVRKMDHYCPWVGGMVSETSFKFFTQFVTYCTCFCVIVLAATAYTVARQVRNNLILDPQILVALALSAFFGLFCFLMAVAAWRFVFTNLTNIDILKKQVTYLIAVRVPLGTRPTSQYHTVTYPLPRPEAPNGDAVNGNGRLSEKTTPRDALARRTFAVLRTEPGENPWDLGVWKNVQQIMGYNVFEFMFPISRSPCTNHDDPEGDYPFGPLIEKLMARHGLHGDARVPAMGEGIELQSRERRSDRI